MMGLSIQIDGGEICFRGGTVITGIASWSLQSPPHEIVLELLWTTRGKGTVDSKVVETVRYAKPLAREQRPFALTLPSSPVSFSGKLVSLAWYLRLWARPSNEQTQLKIIISPTGRELEVISPVG
jgi:hypothetical protein